MTQSAYVFKDLQHSGQEGKRLGAQAQAFVDLELPEFLKRIPQDAKIADFGCGTGVISAALAMNLPEGRVWGLDPDEAALELARKQGAGIANLEFERFGFGEGRRPASGPFDVAFTRLVLLHLPDPGAAIAEMSACLKPGGLLYLVDCDDDHVNFSPPEPWQERLIGLMKQAQESRGGTRTLGSRLLGLVSRQGLWPEGSRVVYYSTRDLGLGRWKQIFLPALGNMAERDIKELSASGALDAAQAESLRRDMQVFFDRPDASAQLSAWHVWARKA